MLLQLEGFVAGGLVGEAVAEAIAETVEIIKAAMIAELNKRYFLILAF